MFGFLVKGIFRDRRRFLFPLILISAGAALTVLITGYIMGMIGGMIEQNACIDTGHVKVMTRAYAQKKSHHPNQLALVDVDQLIAQLERDYPGWTWRKRIYFDGILDLGNQEGSSPGRQGPVSGIALDFSSAGCVVTRLHLKGGMGDSVSPVENEVVIGKGLSEKLGLEAGSEFIFLGSTMYGSIAFQNLRVSAVVPFGIPSFEQGVILTDYVTAERLLDMENAAGEILGYLPGGEYRRSEVVEVVADFNAKQSQDKFAPIMLGLEEQNNLADRFTYFDRVTTIFISIFVIAMSLLLWNTSIISGIRRYQEFGIRLALGESKGILYRFLILESIFIGFLGSLLGTLIGLGMTYYLKQVGIDIGDLLQDASVLIPTVIRAQFSFTQLYIGFVPGLLSTVLGSLLSGIGIFKRQTSSLLKELEV